MKEFIKEKVIGATGSISGMASILGSWQICHNICLLLVAALGILGITVAGMPLLFLTKLAIPLWSTAVLLLIITIILYIKKGCISKNLIIFNSGLIVAGIPFKSLEKLAALFWITGGIIAAISIILFVKGRIKGR